MHILSGINWVDVLVVILMVRMSYGSFLDGLSHQIFPFFASIAILAISLHYYTRLGQLMGGIQPEVANALSYIALVVVLGFIVKFVKIILDKIVQVQWHPVIEKFGGLLVGIAKAYVMTAIVLTMLSLMPLSYLQWSVRERSLTGKYFLAAGPEAYTKFKVFLSDNSTVPKKAPAKKEPS